MTHQKLLAIVSAVWVLSEVVLAIIRRRATKGASQDRGSFTLLWIALVAGIIAASRVQFFPPTRMPNVSAFFWTGIALIVIGIVVRVVAIATLGRMFTVQVTIQQDHQLIDRGIYSKVRHPSYTGSLLSFAGLGLAFGNWLSLALVLLGALVGLLYRIRVEEAALLGHFGDQYRAYSARTKRLIPGIY